MSPEVLGLGLRTGPVSLQECMDEINSHWLRLFMDGWKPHWVSTHVYSELTQEGEKRHHRFLDAQAATEAYLELPGMAMIGRTYQAFEVDGLKVSFPSQDCHSFIKELRGPARKFENGVQYYKLHGWMNCLVLTVEQRDALLALMEARWTEIQAAAMAEDDEFARRIRSINKRGVKVISTRDPESMKGVVEKKLVSKPNNEKN